MALYKPLKNYMFNSDWPTEVVGTQGFTALDLTELAKQVHYETLFKDLWFDTYLLITYTLHHVRS